MDELNKIHIKEFIQLILEKVNTLSEKLTKRKRLMTAKEVLYFITVKNSNNYSYDQTNTLMQVDNIMTVCKQAIIKQRNKLSPYEIVSINKSLLNYIYPTNEPRELAVDGSYLTFTEQMKDTYRTKTNGPYTSGLLSSIYDIKKKIPINYSLYSKFDERQALMDQINNGHVKKGDILVGDRGYPKKQLYADLKNKGIDFIFRIKSDDRYAKLLKTHKSEGLIKVSIDRVFYVLKIVRYQLDDSLYYLCTSLINKDMHYIREVYRRRWEIETDFRHLKHNLSMEYNWSHVDKFIHQDVAVNNFIQIVNGYMEYLLRPKHIPIYKINRTNALTITANRMLYTIFYEKELINIVDKVTNMLNIIKNKVTKIKRNRKFRRKRKTPAPGWINNHHNLKFKQSIELNEHG